MTVQNVGDYETGLEQFGMEDAVIPRIQINHKEQRFVDSLSNEEFDSMQVIFLGLVKQRILWHPSMDDDDAKPMCRSANFKTGFPDLNIEKQPKEKLFPWDKSGFRPDDYPPDPNDGMRRLPCEGCQLKEWNSHPDGKKPYCSEQFTMPLLYDAGGRGDNFVPAIISFQKTSLKPLKSYLSSFARSKQAAFSVVTEMRLDAARRGQTVYSIPTFKKVGETDQNNWAEYSTNYRQLADFLQADPGSRDDDAPPVEAESTMQANDPWSGQTATQQTVQGTVTEEPPAQTAPTQPVTQAPPTASQPPQPPSAPAAPAAAAPAADDDDLPF